VNRAALPAVFNPDDLHSLEAALTLKDRYPGTRVHVVTMGPPAAEKVLKQSLFRGADSATLVSDRRFAAADTLATSYALKCAVEKIGRFDLVFCGRQAIDGDTAQVGPQTAEKLGVNQVTFVSRIEKISGKEITVIRSIEGGFEKVSARLPLLLTFTNENYFPRPPSAKRIMTYKNASFSDQDGYDESYIETGSLDSNAPFRLWDLGALDADPALCGLSGSPTKVKKVESVILKSAETRIVENTEEGLRSLIRELEENHTLG
jgi:electron transfer flavoprotein beta subunit